MSNNRLTYLLDNYLQKKHTAEEKAELFSLLLQSDNELVVKQWLDDSFSKSFPEKMEPWTENEILQTILQAKSVENQTDRLTSVPQARIAEPRSAEAFPDYSSSESLQVHFLRKWRWVAASIILIFSAGAYLWTTTKEERPTAETQSISTDKPPGMDGAILTLADGRKIVLDSLDSETIALQEGLRATVKNGVLMYHAATAETAGAVVYNTMTTPNGRQFSLMLPDGTKVWLNASSSIRFPTMFPRGKREVYITGEAYFEVVSDKSSPFLVKLSNNSEVMVTGTHFNINSYANESAATATLVEGEIKVVFGNSSNILNPGQQATMNKDGQVIVLNDADLEEAVAWKNGKFQFGHLAIDAVLRQLARWYDVDIKFQGDVVKHFGGSISRDVNLSQVLKMLEMTGEIKFSHEGKTIIATPL